MSGKRKIELLAPARDLPSAVAAVDWGADAVYMGGARFGARHAAGNSVEDIARAVAYGRPYGVRVYATLNTLLFEDELSQAETLARELIDAGVDALIIQDMAYLEMGLEGVELHASTQLFNASAEKVLFLERAGFSRVILERGLTFEEIRRISEAAGVELECFLHGAICVGYSGRCWLSRSMGPRSGNRGECSQPCRQTYDLLDATGRAIVEGKHLLSVQDLDLSARVGELLDGGITSFKIEGRLKDPGYVKNVVGYYRRVLDREIALRPSLVRASSGESLTDVIPDLSKSFTRGRSEYYFGGKVAGVASFDTPKAVGEHIGNVIRMGEGWFEIDGDKEVAPGDGICFPQDGELAGTNVNSVRGRRIFPNREITTAPGTAIYRNYDHVFSSALERSRTRRVLNVRASVRAQRNLLAISFTDTEGNTFEASREGEWGAARDPQGMSDTIRRQAAKSGDTIFRVTDVAIDVRAEGEIPFIPVGDMNALRREALDGLLAVRLASPAARNIVQADPSYPWPSGELDATENVTNSLATAFWTRHGVARFEPALELMEDFAGECVMRTPYCIRREIGRCLLDNPADPGPLRLQHGVHRYRLEFDCGRCEMKMVKE